LSVSQRWQEIRDGFEPPFWVANISELFERLSYYAAFASLARYLNESLNFPSQQAGSLAGLFGDWFGFWRRLVALLPTGWDFVAHSRSPT
jgi:hypothetical protein